MRMKEQLALAEIERAQIALSEAYKTIGGAENKRDRLKAFVRSIFPAMADVLSQDAERFHAVQKQSNQRLQLDTPSA